VTRLTFATLAVPGLPARQTALLAAGIRAFGGALAEAPIRVFVPEGLVRVEGEIGPDLARLGVDLLPLTIESPAGEVPFGRKAAAAAAVESASADTPLLAWLDRDTLVLREPSAFLLAAGVALGYRPVHHRLIGTEWGRSPDGFWSRIWQVCGVPEDRQFPMTTSVGERIRPYLNAGLLVVRPERGLLAAWDRGLRAARQDQELGAWCEHSERHLLFLHQAVLTAVALATLDPAEMADLGPGYNYPLHLHGEVPASLRPGLIDDLATARFEEVLFDPQQREGLPMSPSLRRWLASQLEPGRS